MAASMPNLFSCSVSRYIKTLLKFSTTYSLYKVTSSTIRSKLFHWLKPKRRLYLAAIAVPAIFSQYIKDLTRETDVPTDEIVTMIKRAVLYHHKEQYAEADTMFHETLAAIEDRQNTHGFEDYQHYLYAKINVFSRMAALKLTQQQFSEAEMFYVECMKLCLATGIHEDDNSIIELSFKLATLYAMRGEDELATKGYQHCLSVQSEKVKTEDEVDEDTLALYGMVNDGYGRFLLQKHDYHESEKLLETALEIGCNVHGINDSRTLVLWNNLVISYILQGKYELAKKYLQDAIKSSESAEKCEEVGALYSNLGAVYLRMNELDLAYRACAKALAYGEDFSNHAMQQTAKKCFVKVSKARREQK